MAVSAPASAMPGPLSASGADMRSLRDGVSLLSRAADEGQEALFSEAKVLLRGLLGARDVRILVRSGGMWRDWNRLDGDDCVEPLLAQLIDDIRPSDDPARRGQFIIAQVSASSVAIIVETILSHEPPDELVRTLCELLRLALSLCKVATAIRTSWRPSRSFSASRKSHLEERQPDRDFHADHPRGKSSAFRRHLRDHA